MKKQITTIVLTILAFGTGYAQTTIPGDAMKLPVRPDSAAAHHIQGAANIAMPATGSDQEWNYSDLEITGNQTVTQYLPESGNTNFPDAEAVDYFNPALGLLTLDNSSAYYKQENGDIIHLGFETQYQEFPLGGITGDPNDSLIILNSVNNFNPSRVIHRLPMEYEDSWETSTTTNIDFLITVQMMGYSKDSGNIIQHTDYHDTVVGWGSLSIDTTHYNEVPALLTRHTYTQTDSFFINDQPAPQQMLDEIGVQQGQTTSQYYYRFYVHDTGDTKMIPAMEVRTDAGSQIIYEGTIDSRPYSAQGENSVAEHRLMSGVEVYPNPVSNSPLTIEFQNPQKEDLTVSVLSISGALVKQVNLKPHETRVELQTSRLKSGMYLLQAKNKDGDIRMLKQFVKK